MDMVVRREKVRLSRRVMVWALQRARAAGVHVIVRQPRPSVSISIPGVIGGVVSSLGGYERKR